MVSGHLTGGGADHPLGRLFDAHSVAIVGASPRADSVGGHLTRKLTRDFTGKVHLVNPKHREIDGRPCHRTLRNLPEGIDLAVIASPARTVPRVLEDCAAGGIGQAVVISAGFGEAGKKGRALQSRASEIARAHGIRFVGPNCVGLQRPASGLDASFLRGMPPPGHLGLVSQSGAICSAIVDWAGPNDLGFSSVISLGNAADIGFGDAISFLAADPATDAILLYVEGIRDARRFVSALRAATRLKPVIVLKAGRGTAAAAAASTHTGALLGTDAAFDAALERGGAVRVETFGQLFAAAEMLGAGRRATGDRLGIVTNGGGAGVLAADRAEEMGLRLPAPSRETVAALDAVLSPHWSRGNPLDILGDAPPAAFEAAMRAGLADPAFDGLLMMLTPQAVTDAGEVARRAVGLAKDVPGKPVLFCWMGEASVAGARRIVSAAGLPDFTTPERAAEAFAFLARHHRNTLLAQEVPGPRADARPDAPAAARIVAAALAEGRRMLSDEEAKAVLAAFGIPVGETRRAATAAAAVEAAEALGWPVAVKIDSPDISHKSDVGGVRLDVGGAADLAAAFAAVTDGARAARPRADIRGVTVEPMARIRDARELLVGVSGDAAFGPVIAFGAGGTLVELMRDSAVALPPLTEVLAERLIARTRVAALLGRVRDLAPVDRDAVLEVLLRVSDLVERMPEIVALDINPLLAGPDGVLALDARIEVAPVPPSQGFGGHLAVAPYPYPLERRLTLPGGRTLLIRPIRPEDAEQEQAFVRSLSSETRRLRFMGALKALAPKQLARFTQIDYATEMALVALVEGPGGARQVGVARHTLGPDARTAEFAIVVAGAERGQGIGTRLMTELMAAARAQGATRMVGDVLAENRAMLTLMGELGFVVQYDPMDRTMVRVERAL
jgi:acetyltransferase